MALGSHLERSCREIASVLEDCVTALHEYGLKEEVLRIISFALLEACCRFLPLRSDAVGLAASACNIRGGAVALTVSLAADTGSSCKSCCKKPYSFCL